MASMDEYFDIDAWRRVHRQLTLALVQSRDNIAAELTKRRYLLEEMNRCKMQNTQKSATNNSSGTNKSKKKVAPKKMAVPSKEKVATAAAGKGGKRQPPSMATSADVTKSAHTKTKKQKTQIHINPGDQKIDGVVHETIMASVVAPPMMGIGSESSPENQSKRGDSNGSETVDRNPHFSGITSHQLSQMYYPPTGYGTYGNAGIGMATPQQLELAFAMMQQINQNAAAEEENAGDAEGTAEQPC